MAKAGGGRIREVLPRQISGNLDGVARQNLPWMGGIFSGRLCFNRSCAFLA